jgi:hypothetical protein
MEEFAFSRVISPLEDNRCAFDALGLQDLISGVCKGFQETVFAYGQTGSGKTHTILGSGRTEFCTDTTVDGRAAEMGLLQLCTHQLFNTVFSGAGEKTARRYIQLVCLEIKNEEMIDLIPASIVGGSSQSSTSRPASGASTPRSTSRLGPMHVTQENICIKGKRIFYRKVTAWSYDETMMLLREAIASREVGTSSLNSESSRSHMVIRFFVKTLPVADANGTSACNSGTATPSEEQPMGVMGSLTLVDLAGNERENPEMSGGKLVGVQRSAAQRARDHIEKGEAKAINVSLTHLNRMLLKMQNGQLDESDRRQGTLNMILYDSLREDCGATMIFCIHPERRFALQARSTLQMALRCRRIVRQKRVRRIEPAMEAAQEAAQELHRNELHRTAQLLQDLRKRYEEKTKDLETVRAKLESRSEYPSGDPERHQLSGDSSTDGLMRLLCQQLQQGQRPIIDKDGQLERQDSKSLESLPEEEGGCMLLRSSSRDDDMGAEVFRHSRKALVDEESLRRELELARSRDVQAYEDRCSALENELRSVKEDHERELRSLKDALQQQGIVAQGWRDNRESSAGEPCSEPSMGSGDGDDEVLRASRHSIERAPTPQHFGVRHREEIGDLQAGQCPAQSSRSKTTRWHHSIEDAKPALSKVDRVLVTLQRALGGQPLEAEAFDGLDAQPFENAEAMFGKLCRLAQKGHIDQKHRSQCVELAMKAARHHSSSLKIRRDVAKVLVEIGNKDPGMKEEMIAQGAIKITTDTLQFLLSLFSTHRAPPASAMMAPDVCSTCFRLLATLCRTHRGHESCAQPDEKFALETVLKCLAVPELIDIDSSINGCYLIMTLVDKRSDMQKLVRERNGILLLLQLLEDEVKVLEENEAAQGCDEVTRVVEPTSATLCYYIAGCLAKVVQDNAENQQALYSLGGIMMLLRTLKTCLYSGEVVGNACMAIAFTAHQHEHIQSFARSQGAVETILDALLAYRGQSSVQIGVGRAIATLTEKNETNQEAFLATRLPDHCLGGKTGAVALLVEVLGAEPDGEPLVTTVCWALSNLITGNPEAMDHVRQLHGLDAIVSLLRSFGKEERAVEYLCLVLIESVRGGSAAAQRNRQELWSLGAKDAITAMATHHAQSDFVLLRAREALQNLRGQDGGHR